MTILKSEISNLNSLYKLVNIHSYSNIESDFFNVENEDLTINNNTQEAVYIESYCPEFKSFFDSINSKNEHDNGNLYDKRLYQISKYKKNFLKNIVIIKKQKGTLEYVEFILDFYVRMKYFNQYTQNVYSTGDVLRTDKRYRVIKQGNIPLNLVQENGLFRPVSNLTLNGAVVIEDFYLNVESVDVYSYNVKCVVTNEEWEYLIKPLVHPIGFDVMYLNVNEVSSNDIIVQHSINKINTSISTENINMYVGFEDLNFSEYANILEIYNSVCIKDLHSNGKFTLSMLSII